MHTPSYEYTWKDWFIQTPECLAAAHQPGECVGAHGPIILGTILIAGLLILATAILINKRKTHARK